MQNNIMNNNNGGNNNHMMQHQQPGPGQVVAQPIASLSPHLGTKAWIRARVQDKSEIRTWDKPNSTGKLFSCTLNDESDSIRATFFNEGVDKFFDMLQNGGVYNFGGGTVKNANKRFTTVANNYELSYGSDGTVTLSADQGDNIPRERFNFVPISVLEHKEKYAPVDVMCCITKVSPATSIVAKKTGKEMMKRTLTVADPTASVDVTLWEENAVDDSYERGMVLAVRNASVGQWDGVSLSFGRDTTIVRDPPGMEGAETLKKWYRNTGGESKLSLSNKGEYKRGGGDFNLRGMCHFSSIESSNLGRAEKPDFIQVHCIPIHVRTDSVWYDACPVTNKKVLPNPDGTYRCETCDKNYVNVEQRYLASVHVNDGLDTQWLTLFNESGEAFFGCTAKELKQKVDAEGQDAVANLSKARIHRPMVATIRLKENMSSMATDGADRVRCTATRIEWVTDFAEKCRQMLQMIESGYGQS